jgi:hypothetical protein
MLITKRIRPYQSNMLNNADTLSCLTTSSTLLLSLFFVE